MSPLGWIFVGVFVVCLATAVVWVLAMLKGE